MLHLAIAGATGYTGSELIRLLHLHPEVSLKAVTSERNAGKPITDIHPQLQGITDLKLQSLKEVDLSQIDTLFLALPHRVSMKFVAEHSPLPCSVIDLSGDFRLPDVAVYEKWYDVTHAWPQGIGKAAYGLPELFRDQIKGASLVANPGCFPTSAILPLAPLVKEGLVEPGSIVVDAKSGVTGAGASAKDNTHFPHASDNFSAYGIKTHRHTPEIELSIARLGVDAPMVQFSPHLLPVNRGILTDTYSVAKPGVDAKQVEEVFASYYGNEPFIRLRDHSPQLRYVRATNFCDIFATYDERTNRIITISAIDNLVKGAAGQAIQNLNVLHGLDETTGLFHSPVSP
ncbi:MAG: N-acetyl-gamma-glutamyl-phosphate reductase [Cyclonatronaceae bacterium]